MSKSSAATTPKLQTPLPQRSAWARGPPNSSSASTPRTQSPAPASVSSPVTTSHSRRPSTLGQGVSFRDGVAGARSPVGPPKQGVTFGSIDDVSAPISSSPASVPPIKTEAPKTFGTVNATPPANIPTSNGKPVITPTTPSTSAAPSTAAKATTPSSASALASTSSKPPATATPKFDVKKLFQTSSAPPQPSSSQPPSEAAPSPSTRPAPLPQSPAPSGAQPSQFGGQFTTFVPGSGLRPQPNGTNANGPPRSPVYSRAVPNTATPAVNVNGRPPAPGTPAAPPTPLTAGMPSPRMGPHPTQPQPGLPPGQPVAWQYYYPPAYPGMPDAYGMYPQWGVPPHMPPHQHPHTPGVPPQHQPQHPAMMSPRNPPSNLHPPGTPTITPAPVPGPHPSPHMHTSSLSSVSSPPATPSSSTGPGAPGARMDGHAKPFIPGRKGVTIKDESGHEVNLQNFRKSGSNFTPPIVVPSSPARKTVPVRLETEEARLKRVEEEKKKEEEKARREKEAAQRAQREKEEKERVQKEKEEAERKKKEEEERRKEEEKERLRKIEEEKERIRKEEEEKERKRKEEEERLRREQEEKERQERERIRREEEEEKERLRKEEEEKERQRKEEEERLAKEAEAKAAAEAAAAAEAFAASESKDEDEEGEVAESKEKKEEARDKPSPLRIDTAVTERKRPGPLDLSGAKGPIPQPLPSALATARVIEDLASIEYPEGVKSPQVELNVNAKQGKFRYDRDFLLQFMAICKEKPDSLPPLDAIGLEPTEQNFPMVRGGSGSRRQSSMSMGPSTAGRQGSFGLGITGINKPSGGFNMGQFATGGNKMTSEERFAASASRSASMSGSPAGMPFGRPVPMVRSSSQGGAGSPMGSGRTRSKRGEKRGENKAQAAQSAFAQSAAAMAAAQQLEPVAPLEVSANRWTASSIARKPQQVDENSPEVVERKVKSLLNKLTMEKFDSISDQIITWANKSEAEKDGRTLIQVIRLVFEKATDEATWSEMYARLCRKMMEQISPKVQDDGIRNSEGKPITGGHLFRKYLLNRCQEDFERGWASKEAAAAAAATKASQDEATKAANEKNKDSGENELYSDEYYAAQKAKRQGLGLIKFIGELFKLQMLTERIMHECVKKLLGNVENPEEEEIESLCKLLTTVGQLLDTPKARAHMDVYFSRMKELTKSQNVTSRMQFMLQDVIELRERKWIPRNAIAAPTTIAAVHEAAAKEKAAAEKDAQYQRTLSMSRGGSRRGGDRGESQVGPDGWAVAGGGAQNRAPPKAGDLSKFGKIDKSQPMTFGPSSVFAGRKEGSKRDSTISRTGSVNMFSMLSQNPELAAEAPQTKSSRPPSRKPSIDLGSGGAPDGPPQRKKLNLLPRTRPVEAETPAASAPPSEDEGGESGASMSEEDAKKRIDEDVKEFFAVRNLDEAEVYFTKLPTVHRHKLVDKLITKAVESKDADATLVADLFSRAASKELCTPEIFEEGVIPTAEIIDDIAIDAPLALPLFAKMLKGAGLDKDEERRNRIANRSMDADKLLGLLS